MELINYDCLLVYLMLQNLFLGLMRNYKTIMNSKLVRMWAQL
jgi:hypothetical protein